MGIANFISHIFLSANNENDKSKRAYLAFKIALLLTGLISMTSLTVRDLIKLQNQYDSNEPVTSVKLIDASVQGIRLPNATLCIQVKFTDPIEFDISLNNISEFKSRHLAGNLKLAQRLIHASVNINNPNLKLESFESDYSTLGEQLDNFWKNLTQTVCRTVRLQVVPFGMEMLVQSPKVKGRGEYEWVYLPAGSFDVCNNDDLTGGFLTEDMNVFCFRIPLDRFRFFKRSSYTRDYTSSNYVTQRMYVALQPLFMTNLYENKSRIRPASVFLYFPEKVGSYLDFQYSQESMKFDSDFWTIVKSPDDYGCGRTVTVNAEFWINAKYQRLSDKKDCVDVYDRSERVVKCMEDSYSELCKCRRKAYRHYPNINSKEYCTFRQEWECAQQYRQEFTAQHYLETNETMQCFRDCDHCVRLDFASSIRTVVSQIGEKNRTNSTGDLSCDSVRTPWIKYELALTSFNYPFFIDTPLITEEGYIAQIGGVFGLYLGLSGIACFTIVVQFISWMKRRFQVGRENRKCRDNVLLSFVQVWWTVGKLKSYDIDKKSELPVTKF